MTSLKELLLNACHRKIKNILGDWSKCCKNAEWKELFNLLARSLNDSFTWSLYKTWKLMIGTDH